MTKIHDDQLAALPSQIRAQRKLEETQNGLMTMIKQAAQNEKFKQLDRINLESDGEFIMESKNFRWGRFGFYLPIDQPDASGHFWNPGIFIGVLCDDINHGPNFVTNVDGQGGPIACLIMSINKPWHDKYKKSDEFRGLVDKLRECWPATSTKSWQVYEDRETRNIWHPVFIYKPLKHLFREKEKGEDQVECFAEEMSEIASVVLELDEFCRFKKSLT